MPAFLRTERLVLDQFRPQDAERYAALVAERGPGARHFGMTPAAARQHIARVAAESAVTGIGFLAIRLAGTAEMLGYCGLLIGRTTIDEPEIAYELFRDHHGRGYATEAAAAVVGATAATGRHRLWATVGSWNDASLRVLEKLRFHRDHSEVVGGGEVVYLVRDLR